MQRFPLPAIGTWGNIEAPIGFAIGMIAGAVGYFSLSFEPSLTISGIVSCVCWSAYAFARRLQLPPNAMSCLILLLGGCLGLPPEVWRR